MPAPKIDFKTPEKYWDDAEVGDECVSPTYTVTRERILAYADLTGDHTPVHVDEAYAKKSHFGALVAHGPSRWIRHPMYSAVIAFGLACAWRGEAPWAWLSFGTLLSLLVVKAAHEARGMLEARSGDATCQRTHRFLPGHY